VITDVSAQTGNLNRIGLVADVGLRIDQLTIASESGHALRIDLQHIVDLVYGSEKDIDEKQEGDESAVGQLVVDHEPGAADHDDDLSQAHAEVGERHARGHDPVRLELCIAVPPVVLGEELAFVVLIAKGLDDPNATDVFFDAGVELADTLEE
jgi:hypothetical protein